MARRYRLSLWTLLIAVSHLTMLPDPSQAFSPWDGLDKLRLADTCRYFENRARFVDRNPEMPLNAAIADSCTQAYHRFLTAPGASPYEAKRARAYLETLSDFKHLLIDMNTQGFAKARLDRPVQLGGRPRIQVSEMGEYLIARQMGVLERYKAWARASRYQSIALAMR